jgi:predicted sugar kinase
MKMKLGSGLSDLGGKRGRREGALGVSIGEGAGVRDREAGF